MNDTRTGVPIKLLVPGCSSGNSLKSQLFSRQKQIPCRLFATAHAYKGTPEFVEAFLLTAGLGQQGVHLERYVIIVRLRDKAGLHQLPGHLRHRVTPQVSAHHTRPKSGHLQTLNWGIQLTPCLTGAQMTGEGTQGYEVQYHEHWALSGQPSSGNHA